MRAERTSLRSAERGLLGFAVICAVAMAVEVLWPHPITSAVDLSALATTADPSAVGAWKPGPLDAYRVVTDRPLFAADRRPYKPPEPEAVAPAPPLQHVTFELNAIVTSADAQLALLKSGSSAKASKLALNDVVEGWTLTEIRSDEVVLRKGPESQIVPLQKRQAGEPRGLPVGPIARDQ